MRSPTYLEPPVLPTAIHGDSTLEEGLNTLFIARRKHQTWSVSCTATSNLTIVSPLLDSAFVEKRDL